MTAQNPRIITLKSNYSFEYDGWKFSLASNLVDTKARYSEEIEFIEKSAFNKAVEALKDIATHQNPSCIDARLVLVELGIYEVKPSEGEL